MCLVYRQDKTETKDTRGRQNIWKHATNIINTMTLDNLNSMNTTKRIELANLTRIPPPPRSLTLKTPPLELCTGYFLKNIIFYILTHSLTFQFGTVQQSQPSIRNRNKKFLAFLYRYLFPLLCSMHNQTKQFYQDNSANDKKLYFY